MKYVQSLLHIAAMIPFRFRCGPSYKVPGAITSAMEVTFSGSGILAMFSLGPRRGLTARGQRGKDGVEVAHDLVSSPDHQTVAARQPEYATAGAGIDVVQSFPATCCADGCRRRSRVAFVYQHVILLQKWHHPVDDPVDDAGPDRSSRSLAAAELLHQLLI